MATYRQVHISFWQDPYIEDLSAKEKYFYIYLMTNSKTKQCGCYEISMKLVKYETALTQQEIDSFIVKLSIGNKIRYNQENQEFLILNWLKHNSFRSPKVLSCILKELESIKTDEFKQYVYNFIDGSIPIDSLSIDYPKSIGTGLQKEKEEEQEKTYNNTLVKDVIDYLNEVACTSFKPTTKKTIDVITARVNEGFSDLEQYKRVVDIKSSKWLNTEQAQYLRPETLFGPKFEGYLNEKPTVKVKATNELKGALGSPNPTKRVAEW